MLNKNLQKDTDIHKKDNQRIMRENVELIKEINELRDQVRQEKQGGLSGDLSKKGREFKSGRADNKYK